MIRIISPGRTKNPAIRMLEEDYIKRISRFHRINLVYPDVRLSGKMPVDIILKREEEVIRKYLKGRFIVLDVHGVRMSTGEFAGWLGRNLSGTLDFVIGGPWGVSSQLKEEASLLLSLSDMIFSHELVRVMLLEQIYRAFFPTFNK